jgi:AmmeMemoRadiSam system protein B/AmmeMemoRadiSam system protein A
MLNRFLLCIIIIGALFMAEKCEGKEFRTSPHAGSWYPGTEKELRETIAGFLKKARAAVHGDIVALISPHAGYVYSGPVAAYAYKSVEGMEFDDVIVIGPSHRHAFYGASVDTSAGRETPLGKIDFDVELAKRLVTADKDISYEPGAHAVEHSVEIQMPFIQFVIKKFKAVEIIMGTQDYKTCEMLSKAIVKATKGRKVLVVASSDLSHYQSQKRAETLDNMVVDAVAKFDPELLHDRLSSGSCDACGGGPVITAMLVARELGATKSKPLRYATSGDISGDYSEVVGYMAAALYRADEVKVGVDLGFSDAEKETLREIARSSIESAVRGKQAPEPKGITKKLKEPYGIFVTIKKHGDLRGCIGWTVGDRPVYQLCQRMARAAALQDPRFSPVTADELPDLEIEISVLTPMQPVRDKSEIVIGRDGLFIQKGTYGGLYLPQVPVEQGWDVDEFLVQTCYKAGIPVDSLRSKDTQVFRFSAEVF